MSRIVWPGSQVPKRYESQWLGSVTGNWWRLSYHRFKLTAIMRAALNVHGDGRVLDHGKETGA